MPYFFEFLSKVLGGVLADLADDIKIVSTRDTLLDELVPEDRAIDAALGEGLGVEGSDVLLPWNLRRRVETVGMS